jgi:hypothetical protein
MNKRYAGFQTDMTRIFLLHQAFYKWFEKKHFYLYCTGDILGLVCSFNFGIIVQPQRKKKPGRYNIKAHLYIKFTEIWLGNFIEN